MLAYFVSDLHLKTLNERNAHLFLGFLRSLKKVRPSHLFLLGDLFDFWVGDHDFYEIRFRPLVEALLDLQSSGTDIVYFEGNHDVHVKKFWEGRHRIPVYVKPKVFEIDGLKLRMEHGDDINPEDTLYFAYRDFIRSGPLEKLADRLPPREFHSFGQIASRLSRRKSSRDRNTKEPWLREMIRSYAHRQRSFQEFDWIFTGHVHVRDEWSGGNFQSVNLGSWFDVPQVYRLEKTLGRVVGGFEFVAGV